MQCLKDAICQSPALCQLDYESGREVILAIDTSLIVVGYILSQERDDGKCYLNHFGSIGLSNVESHYSQAKLKLYGLFHALQVLCGLHNQISTSTHSSVVQGHIEFLSVFWGDGT